ncbi:MAG: hydantoinase/oxoprolinase family protein, partial [Candidatus Binataceae bacterium]
VHEELMTRPLRHPAEPRAVQQVFNELLDRVQSQLAAEGFAPGQIEVNCSIDMRYRRQVHILTVPLEEAGDRNAHASVSAEMLERTIGRFEALYIQKYGPDSTFREAGIELVTFRVRGAGYVRKPEIKMAALGGADSSHAVVETRDAYVPDLGRVIPTKGYDFERLMPGNVIAGPAIIWTPITTVVTNSRQTTICDGLRNLIITSRSGS